MVSKHFLPAAFFVLTGVLVFIALTLTKMIRPNLLFVRSYPINGVDVSAYQGRIDWERLAPQGLHFAYIKATEGSSFTDKCFLDALEEAYGQRPVIYATEKSYRLYISGSFDEYDIWIRNVYTPPLMPQNKEWTFWQYTDTERLDGYSGEEACIDRNVFNGTAEEFAGYYGGKR